MIEACTYKPGHLDFMDRKSIFYDCIPDSEITFDLGISLLTKTECLAVFFGYMLFPGCMRLSAIVSKNVSKVPVAFHKACVSLIAENYDRLELNRLQVTVRQDLVAERKWIESLGFKGEGVLKKYGHDQKNYIMYART